MQGSRVKDFINAALLLKSRNMNKEMTELLKQLAAKLGTTTEYLWQVLIKQAYINGIGDIIEVLLVMALGFALWKLHLFLLKDDKHGNSYYYNVDPAMPCMVIGAIIWFIFLMICLLSITEIVSCFANPEYWALKQILEKV